MGDFCVPKRKEVYEKIRRRIEGYRQRHSESAVRYFDARLSACEQQKQETLLLRQRWLDSKAKKAAKQSKSSRDSTNSQSDHRNLVVSKLKRKIDSISAESSTSTTASTTTTTTASEAVFNFEDNDQQPSSIKNSKINCGNNIGFSAGNKHSASLPSLSVQIVQQISANCQQDTPQTIHTNVTVSSCFGTDLPNTGGASHSVHTSVQCKQEPSEGGSRPTATNSSSLPAIYNSHIDPGDISIGIDVEELQNFLASFENGKGQDPTLIKQLNEFKEILDKVQRESESNESCNVYSSLDCPSPGLLKGVFSNLDPCGHMGTMFDASQNINSPALTNHSIPVPAVITEPTGPAAETLKQMAAQHQHQHSPGYQIKGVDHFTDGLHNGGFSPNYSQLYRSVPNITNTFPFNHSTNHHLNDASQMTPEMAASMTYGGTKPLTHFPNEQEQQHNSPSSLQQLQNQVQSHFKPSLAPQHQMHVTQTQHMQLSHGSHSTQLTQSQQVQMQPSPQQISLSQQQNFSMGQPQTVTDLKIMEKLRLEQQQQQAQQNHLPPQYMSRPPPEYKMHHNARPQGTYPNTMSSSGNTNPLQTMQNMVNQTSAYGTVKSEVGTASSPGQTNSGMMPSHISAMQQQTMSVTMSSSGSQIGNLPLASQGIRPGFHSQQHLQQPPAYSVVESSSRTLSTFTSAIMRNQRPPNVSVGPDGLNISQPRTNTDWSRANLIQSSHAGLRPSLSNGCPNTHGVTQAAPSSGHMMQYQQRPPQYGASPNPGGLASATANLTQLQQQQVRQSIPGQMRGTPASGIVPTGTQVMMQHQNMQMSQQMSLHTSNSAYNFGGPTPGTACVSPVGYSMGGPSPGATLNSSQNNGPHPAGFLNQPASNQDEFLHFLDNPLSSDSMFDSIHNTTDEFSLFEDFFNGK